MTSSTPLPRRKLAVLTLWILLIAPGSCYPVVYPSLRTAGFAFVNNDEREVVSIPASFDAFLCRAPGQTQSFEPLNKPCANVVIFTSISYITLRVLNLSTNGVVQPIRSVPRVRLSNEGVPYSWNGFGASGPVDLNPSTTTNSSTGVGQNASISTGEDSSPEDPSLTDPDDLDVPSADAMGSEPAEESIEEEVEIIDDEAEENESVGELLREIPENVDASGVDAIENEVLIANRTSRSLNPDGSVVEDESFVLELNLQSLPEQQLFEVRLDFGEEGTRSLMIYLDSSPATASIRLHSDRAENEIRRRRNNYTFEIRFSKYMLNLPSEDSTECTGVVQPIEALSSRALSGSDSGLAPNDLMAVILATRELSDCSTRLHTSTADSLVEVSGVDASLEAETGQINVRSLRRGRGLNPTVVMATFSVKEGRQKRVKISVRSSSGVTLSGAPVNQRVETYRVGENSDRTRESIRRGDRLGTTSTAAISSSVATSVTTSVGVSIAASVTGTTATGGVGGATAGGSMSGAVDMIHFGQKIYLISRMAVNNFPENFAAYADSLSWTMMDIRTPWKESDDPEEDKELEEQGVTRVDNDEGYKRVTRAFSWTAFLFLCLIALHVTLIALFFRHRLTLPSALRLPRLELYFSYWCMPVIAGASASLFAGDQNQLTLGIILLVTIPFPFVLWHVYIIVKYFLIKLPEHLKVIYELDYRVLKEASGKKEHSGKEAKKDEPLKEALKQEKGDSFFEKYFLSPILGPPYREGCWKTVDGPANKFVDRYGPVFEDYRGLPGLRRDPTFRYTSESQKIDRGTFTPVNPHLRYAIDRSELSHVIKVSGTLLHLLRIIFISCFVLGAENPTSNSQAGTLFTLSAIYLALLRIFRPHCSRWKLALSMVAEILDVGTYIAIFYLINSDRAEEEDVRRNLGIVMLSLEGLGFVLIFLDQGLSSWTIIKSAALTIWESRGKQPRIVEVFQEALLQDSRYLERKYSRIWISKTLGKGLYSGVLKKDNDAPFEEMFWVAPGLAIRKKLLPSWKLFNKETTPHPDL